MKRSKITIIVAELILFAIAGFFVRKIFEEDVPQKRVAVIVENSGDKRWDSLFQGLKHSADVNNLHLIICNTDDIENADDEKALIDEQLDNDVDAFIICPAPGSNTLQMLQELKEETPFVLITEDVYTAGEDNGESIVENANTEKNAGGDTGNAGKTENTASGFPVIKPDNYQMGYRLGQELIKNGGSLEGKKIGIFAGREKTEATVNQVNGLMDALSGTGCEVIWKYYYLENQNVCNLVNNSQRADYICAMDTYVLDSLGEAAENGLYNGAEIYGIGSSMKSVSLLDYGQIKCLVIPDGYGIGYESIAELAKKLDSSFYSIGSYEADVKVIYREDLFSEDVERFLYSYE